MKLLLRLLVTFILTTGLTLAAQSHEIAPGDNLVVEGIPKIPASLAEATSRYLVLREVSMAALPIILAGQAPFNL